MAIILLLISLFPLLSLLHPGLPITHDGQDHVARIANFYLSLSEGNLIPRWAANLNWGFGTPILMFLYPLPSYIASFFHWIGFTFVDSTKLVFGTTLIASVFAMYLWLCRAYGKTAGFVGALLYGFAPYRFVDLYVRGALGEHVAFIFPPVICWGLLTLATSRFPSVLPTLAVSLGTAGLLLSHNALSLIFLPLIFLYVLYLFLFETKDKARFIVQSLWFMTLGFLVSAFFWAPAFFEGKYTLRDIVTKGEFTDRFVPWLQFFTSSWNYGGGNEFSKEVGFLHWLGIVGSLIVLFKTKVKKVRVVISVLLITFFISLFLMVERSRFFWNTITVMQKFQFPWRLLSVTVFASSILGAIVVASLPKKLTLPVTIFTLFMTFVYTRPMWAPKGYLVKPESFYTGIYNSTTDTGESSPIWSVRFMEKQSPRPYEVLEGNATLTSGTRTTTKHTFSVDANIKSRLSDNTLYFPGWNVFVDGKALDPNREILYQDPQYRGLMTFWVEPGKHAVFVTFEETKLRKLADYASLVGLLLLVATVTIRKPLLWPKFP
ncbi:hypothetical protein HY086_02040 [Candidatus Gottesmanbacteria bacterium]|nr:hypothetical protein [Candidatus Gottesmanbacteria bacterium]